MARLGWLMLLLLFAALVNASDLGVNVGSKAASQLISQGLHTALQKPRKLNIEMLSANNPWFDPIAHVDTNARVLVRDMNIRFHDDLVDVKMTNISVASKSNVVLPLPFFLGEDVALVNAQISHAEVHLRAEGMNLALDTCDIASPDIDITLERSFLTNYLLKPLANLPASFIQDIVCNSISGPLSSLRNKVEIKIPLGRVIPAKFVPYLIQKNTTLLIQLQSIQSRDEQLTLVAGIEWGEFDVDEDFREKDFLPLTDDGEEAENLLVESPKYSESELDQRRLELWTEDKLFNQLMEKFDWNFEWLTERIPVDDQKIPQSTREFLGTLCTDCYFELKVSAKGPPHLETSNKTLILTKRDKIFLKVVNPTLAKNSVFISLYLTLKIQVIPKVENGVFRTQINLLNTSIEMEKGAFPSAWNVFVQDLVRDMILNVIWPQLKKEIENLVYSDGIQIPQQCGIEPTSINMYVDDSRFGVSASLALESFSGKQCLRQFKNKLPDPSKLFVIKDGA
ncbi:hypothetical protein M3Y97_00747800 [Aphelenchoides bicaudatus]|nr:hypothetical protein M3Y97_00747800 [Aphelenchoides bicaudatus]